MRPVKSLIVVLLLSCGVTLFGQESGGDRWLRIEVMDAAGQPLSRACVTIVPRTGEIVFRQADTHGRVKVKGLAMGSYRVVVKVDGYEAQKKVVTVDEHTETVAFSLQPRTKL